VRLRKSVPAWLPQLLCKNPSLSGLDRQIFSLFFLWGIISVLFGGVVGGSILTALSPSYINNPGEAPDQAFHAQQRHPDCAQAQLHQQSG
jgi:hypothetical protein